MQQLSLSNFKKGLALTLLTAFVTFIFNYFIGKNELFLLFNADLGKAADYIFVFFTFLGDGVWWILIFLLFILFRKKQLPILVFSFILQELFVELFKTFLIPNQPRPAKAIADAALIHTVKGVELHSIGSFPSGHTTQAFVFFLLACLVIDKKWIVAVGFFYALLIGYSRVYLAQHFPRDVAGGMLFASISVLLSLMIYKKFFDKKNALL